MTCKNSPRVMAVASGKRRRASLRFLRHPHQVIEHLALFHHLGARVALNDTETAIDLDEIRLPLGIDVSHDLRDPKRELALLAMFALVDEGADPSEHLGIR